MVTVTILAPGAIKPRYVTNVTRMSDVLLYCSASRAGFASFRL